MNIGFFCNNLDPNFGGTERVTHIISESLAKRGNNCFFIYSSQDYSGIEEENKLKIDIKEARNSLEKAISFFISHNKIQVLIVVNLIYQTKKFQKIYQNLKTEYDVKIIACLHAAPDNWCKHDDIRFVLPHIYIKNLLKRLLCNIYNRNIVQAVGMYNLCDRYVLLSKRYIPTFEKTFKIDDSIRTKLYAIPNPCPFEGGRQYPSKRKEVLIVSRMSEIQKRIYYALKIWKRLYPITNDWKLIVVGDGPELKHYKRYVKKNKLNNVHFEGASSHAEEFYKRASIFMMTSIWEGQPMTLIESMHYCCVPIVMDSFESVHDFVVDKVNGEICKYNDIEDYSNRLKILLENDQIVNKYRENIKNNLMYNNSDIVSMWIELLNSVVV